MQQLIVHVFVRTVIDLSSVAVAHRTLENVVFVVRTGGMGGGMGGGGGMGSGGLGGVGTVRGVFLHCTKVLHFAYDCGALPVGGGERCSYASPTRATCFYNFISSYSSASVRTALWRLLLTLNLFTTCCLLA